MVSLCGVDPHEGGSDETQNTVRIVALEQGDGHDTDRNDGGFDVADGGYRAIDTDNQYPIAIGGDWPRLPVYADVQAQQGGVDGDHASGSNNTVDAAIGAVVPRLRDVHPAADEGAYLDGDEEGWISGKATHYGVSYNGLPLGCGTGDYHSDNPSIVAVSPSRYSEWPCGTRFEICGSSGCNVGYRHDACPGCTANHLDLSESGIQAVCGGLGTCEITFRVVP